MPLTVNLVPGTNIAAALKAWERQNSKKDVETCLSHQVPKRLAADICRQAGMDAPLTVHNDTRLGQLGAWVNESQLLPEGTEGHRTAEVTLEWRLVEVCLPEKNKRQWICSLSGFKRK